MESALWQLTHLHQVAEALGQLRASSAAHASEVAALRKELGAARKSSSKEGGGAAAELKRLDAAVAGVKKAQGALAKEHGEQRAELGSLWQAMSR